MVFGLSVVMFECFKKIAAYVPRLAAVPVFYNVQPVTEAKFIVGSLCSSENEGLANVINSEAK